MTAVAQKRYTLEEYAEYEYHAQQRHYFYNGIIAPMGYTSEYHGQIIFNLIRELGILIEDADYLAYASERMIHVPVCNLNYYPDIVFIKGAQQFKQLKPKMKATLNPYALIEVISASTEDKDRFDKWSCYRKIPSLQQYFMISQTKTYIDIYNSIEDSEVWANTYVDKMEQVIRVGAFDISVADIYMLVKFPAAETADEVVITD